ncbi:MAG: hypothetical protein HY929_05660 [Euryarchaeota archaeon]|nr:hypothetical protein [Euryarchaeota archaeon]
MPKINQKRKRLVHENLELIEKFLLEIIANPDKLKDLPSGSTIVLYPVLIEKKPSTTAIEA